MAAIIFLGEISYPFIYSFVPSNDLGNQVDAQRPKHPMTAPYDAENGDAAGSCKNAGMEVRIRFAKESVLEGMRPEDGRGDPRNLAYCLSKQQPIL